MPIYEYQCQACGHQLEAFQKVSEAALTECPKCHQTTLNKLVSAAGFQLKGSGWYATDYRDKEKAKQTEKTELGTAKEGGTNTADNKKQSGDTGATTPTPATHTKDDSTSGGGDKSAGSS
ncbi:MAG: hypothetical protein A3F42_04405 [Gammaproteobacteria bacterium RIFCSPHIGHO2_12_FULL_37_34]|nr:MAG: hypothetical protein A3F42_04405 [Gammaproteobacteria bacterium RIFCSPHIGHO2_12_FULL_37_34]